MERYKDLFFKIVKLGDKIEKASFAGYNWITTLNEHKDISTRKKNMIIEYKSFNKKYINMQKLWENSKSIIVSVSNTDNSNLTKYDEEIDIFEIIFIYGLLFITYFLFTLSKSSFHSSWQ